MRQVFSNRNLSPKSRRLIENLEVRMRETEGSHCKWVSCAPDQLFYNKRYSRTQSQTPKDIIEVVNSRDTKGVDILNLMIKYGYGHRAAGQETTTRDLVFNFFKALGAQSLTLFDTSCSVVVPPTPDFNTTAYIKDTEARGALGGTSDPKGLRAMQRDSGF